MSWVRHQGRDMVYRLRWGQDLYEVHRDATVYLLVNRTETVRRRPGEEGRVEHFTKVRVKDKARIRDVHEEVKRRTDGPWWRRWFYTVSGQTRKFSELGRDL